MRYYRAAISNGFFLLPIIALLPLIPYYWRNRKRGIHNPLRLLSFYSFVLYALIAWYFVVLPLPSEAWLAGIKPAGVNLLPFSYFRELSEETGFDIMQGSTWFSAVGSSFALQYWFNILMFVPLGMYLRYLFGADGVRTAAVCLLTTVFFEITQLTAVFGLFSKPYRSFDVDDILCNFLGGVLGYWVMGRIAPLVEKLEKKAAEAYRKGQRVSILRRFAAFAIDIEIMYAVCMLLRAIRTAQTPERDLYTLPALMAGMFVYSVAFTLLAGGSTPGKWLLHFRVCGQNGQPAVAWRVVLRYALLYLTAFAVLLIPVAAHSGGLNEAGVQVLTAVIALITGACFACHVVAAWLFPSQDYPWGVLSKTEVALCPRAHAAHNA